MVTLYIVALLILCSFCLIYAGRAMNRMPTEKIKTKTGWQTRVFWEKVLKSSLLGIAILISLLGVISVVALIIETGSPPAPPPLVQGVPQIPPSSGFVLIGSLVSIGIASFISGWWGTNSHTYSTHGLLSGFIVGAFAPLIVLIISGWAWISFCVVGLGVPTSLIGYIASELGNDYYRIRQDKYRVKS